MPFKGIRNFPVEEYFAPGHGLCAGCTASLTMRLLTKIAGPKSVIINATNCVEVSTTPFPMTSWRIPWMHVAFENTAAVAGGVRAAYTSLSRKGLLNGDRVNVIAVAGDGGTADIGMQALSGAFERGDHITFVCYDNEAYMNTGIQRSGTTPYGAWTTTSPPGTYSIGQRTLKKDLVGIALAHRVKYVATASPSHLVDAANKIEKALATNGPSFLHFLQPCVPGWRIDSSLSIKVARLAVQTGLWPLLEFENGQGRVTVPLTKRLPVIEYLKIQGRFRHLLKKPEEVEKIQRYADELAAKYGFGRVELPPEKK